MKRVLLVGFGLLLLATLVAVTLSSRREIAVVSPREREALSQGPPLELRPATRTEVTQPQPSPLAEASTLLVPPPEADEPMAYVYGTILDPDGQPVRYAFVRFSLVNPREAWIRPMEFDCDVAGSYAGEVPPGEWIASVSLGVSNQVSLWDATLARVDQRLLTLVRPLPIINTLPANTSTEFSFRFGGGTDAINGRIVDEHGQPFEGLDVYLAIKELANVTTGERYAMGLGAFVSRRVTDSDGRFNFDGLEPATYTVSVEPEGFNPSAAPGQSKLGQLVEPLDVRVPNTSAGSVISAKRPHPVLVEGRIVPFTGPVSVVLVLPATATRRASDRRTPVPISEDGTFSFHVEGSELSAILEVTGHETTTVPLAFSPADEVLFITVPFP